MERTFTEGSVFKNIVVFSLPYLLSCFLQRLYGMADLFMAGTFGDSAVITAVATGSQIMNLATVLITGFTMATTVLEGHASGSNNKRQKALVAANSFIVFSLFSLILAAVVMFICPSIVSLMKTPEVAKGQTVEYLSICFAGIPFIAIYNVIVSALRGLGNTRTPMFFIIISSVINIALDALFMGVFKMNAAGAAVATIISQAVSVILAVMYLLRKKSEINFTKSDFVLSCSTIKSLLKIGLPVACQDGFIQVSFLVITAIANNRGVEIAAAVGIVEKLISFIFLVPSSMLSAVSALSAQNIGAGKHDRAQKTLFTAMGICLVFGFVVSSIVQFAAPQVLRLFSKTENLVVMFGSQYIKSYVWDCMIAGVHFCFSGYFCSYGYSLISFVHNIISILTIRIPGAYFTSVAYPDNLWPMGWASTLGSLLSSIICFAAFMILKKKRAFE